MYSIYADGVCIYSDVFATERMKVLSPKLTLEDSAAGSLAMTLPPANIGYDTIIRLKSDISVQKDGEEIWAGRVLQEDKDFWNNRVLYCEGELAYFNDSTQPPMEYSGLSIRAYLEKLIAVHNSKVPANRQFAIGAVTVVDKDYPTYYTNYEKTIALLNALVEEYGGHLRIRKVSGVRYLDYLEDYPDTCSQVIQFGSNLIEFTRKWDSSEFATVIVPLGSRLDESPIEALDAYLTVESVNNGSPYIQSDATMEAYGWIEKTVRWDDVTDPAVLLEKAKAYLTDIQFDNMELELSALDLHYLDVDYEAVKLLDEIRVISRPHGLDRLFPVTKLEIPLDSPEQTQFKLGDTVKTSLTNVNNQTSTAILKKIEGLPKAHTLLKEAKENATHIMNMATTGYITITKDDYGSDTLYISNVRDYTKATKLWKWNMNGLGYSKDGGKTFGLAITMDGAIVADYITAGVLNGDLIRAGTIQDVKKNNYWDLEKGEFRLSATTKVGDSLIASTQDVDKLDGSFTQQKIFNRLTDNGKAQGIYLVDKKLYINAEYIATGVLQDSQSNVMFDLNNGKLTMKKGSIQLGAYSDGHYNFEVDNDGNVYARRGTFAGKFVASSGTIGGFTIESDYLHTGTGGNFVALNGSLENNSEYAIWAGAVLPEAAPFWVKKNGDFYAQNGIFKGTLSAAKIEGTLTGTAGSWLRGCGISVGGNNYQTGVGNFYVDTNGNVTMKGSINLAGSITWSTGNSPCQVLYARESISRPYGSYMNYPNSDTRNWHRTFDDWADYYASYTYDGGNSWTPPVKIRGTDGADGKDGQDGYDGSDASVTRDNIVRAMMRANYSDGLYTANDPSTGEQLLLINADAIRVGIIDAGAIYLQDDYGGFCSARGFDGINNTYGAKMYGSDGVNGDHYVITTNAGVRMQAGRTSFYVINGSVVTDEPIEESSDRRMKKDISYNLEKYKDFFRALKPCSYQFIKGTSGRSHIGYIAQDVEEAVCANNIAATDFAGLVKSTPEEGFHIKLPEEYRLRYSEFIALNTYMIQNAWNEIDRLKAEIQKLKEPLAQ